MSDLCNLINKVTGCDITEISSKSMDPKARYSKISISLSESYTDKELYLAGSFLAVAEIDGSGSCGIKLDYTRSGELDLRLIQEIRANFNRIYLSSDGLGGTCTLYICQAMETSLSPLRPTFEGGTNSYQYESKNYVRRLHETKHTKLSRLKIRNTHAAAGVDFGWVPSGTLPSAADFRNWAYRLIAQDDIEFINIDMYQMGYCSAQDDAPVTLKLIGTRFK